MDIPVVTVILRLLLSLLAGTLIFNSVVTKVTSVCQFDEVHNTFTTWLFVALLDIFGMCMTGIYQQLSGHSEMTRCMLPSM